MPSISSAQACFDSMYTVSYMGYFCDDGVGERVDRRFNDFTEALHYWAEVSETEDQTTLTASANDGDDDDDDIPF